LAVRGLEVRLAALEEAVAGGPEAVPGVLAGFVRSGSDGLPLDLRLLDQIGGRRPLRRVGERGDARTQLLAPLEVFRAVRIELEKMLLAAVEETVAGAPEAIPDRLRLLARGGTDR